MEYHVKSGDPSVLRTACLVLGVFTRRQLAGPARQIDQASNGHLSAILKKGDMEGETGQSLMLYDIPGIQAERILLVGLGAEKELTLKSVITAWAGAVKQLNESSVIEVTNALCALEIKETDLAQRLRESVITAEDQVYRFDQCKSEAKPPKRPLKKLSLFIGEQKKSQAVLRAVSQGEAIAGGITLAKNLSNLPGNLCTPSYLADQARQLGKQSTKLKISVLEEKQMQSLGMGSLLSVSRGSREPAKLIVMEYKGGKPKSKPVVLIGKGLTFDAGGISLKPAAAMDEMKYDMCGGASVMGAMAACVRMELPINLVVIVPSSENLPDGAANKPGDIVTSMSGQTIEILNTDAEGRLILCDALTYAERFDPAAVVDVATLTGACIIALGSQASGLLSNDDKLAAELLEAGNRATDRAWQLPLWDEYQEQLKSNFADMANIGGKGAGTITAACFLSRYAKKFKWAHLDIAGTAWRSGDQKGATGRPVSLLSQFLLKRAGQAK
ncbi:leucyl aminopeptidase [Sedimenticola sp.]|uniref:leucyl aminopeptidase n=1 Tax=Sedimenticola sp. TaxID=1940285 RepID=UPI002589DEB8|nr:leucyl aminopeptidase [Sedimenticola sp.]MCW8902772.1 leucyl aminopeptidase [Sedimenticola sp.]